MLIIGDNIVIEESHKYEILSAIDCEKKDITLPVIIYFKYSNIPTIPSLIEFLRYNPSKIYMLIKHDCESYNYSIDLDKNLHIETQTKFIAGVIAFQNENEMEDDAWLDELLSSGEESS